MAPVSLLVPPAPPSLEKMNKDVSPKNENGTISAIDKRDVGTPDDWVPRHPELIRLTGRHPFNSEPPLSKLMKNGFITSNPVHYVRNHGAVPRLDWEHHRLLISGMVSRPCELTMDDLVAMPSRTFPMTMCCAGNRRKEENATKKSIGFSWGAAAHSTARWTGVLLRDVLLRCGVTSAPDGATHVCFNGVDAPANGTYGTSISLAAAMDPTADVMLAYQMNGELLPPDHGYPIRLIIPGYIGGRMIKWLGSIQVTSQESQSHYHFKDNRVLPSHVDEHLATAEGWWYKPEYIINELNINSAITCPDNNDRLLINPETRKAFTVSGYAYSGGGRKVIRVEVSLDGGKTWRLTDIQRGEKPTEYGRHWCWVFWELALPLVDVVAASEILVRAWDAGQNTQPERLTWNVMGMMNNCWFRVSVNKERSPSGQLVSLHFQHPTSVVPGQHGWMDAPDASSDSKKLEQQPAGGSSSVGGQISPKPSLKTSQASLPFYSPSEVSLHDKDDDCWISVKDRVYDCTPFLKLHPGGADSIILAAGTDATEDFAAIHSTKAWDMLEKYLIGWLRLDDDANSAPASPPVPAEGTASPPSSGPFPSFTKKGAGMGMRGKVLGLGKLEEDRSSNATTTILSNSNSVADFVTLSRSISGVSIASSSGGDEFITPSRTTSFGNLSKIANSFLVPGEQLAVKLVEKEVLSHNSIRMRFALPDPQQVLGLPVCKHVSISLPDDQQAETGVDGGEQDEGEEKEGQSTVARPYTPTSSDLDLGFVELVVKVYRANVSPRYPNGGKLSQMLEKLEVGQDVGIRGPLGHITYHGLGSLTASGRRLRVNRIGLVAGGTGITPCLALIEDVLRNPVDRTQLSLLFANTLPGDILLRERIDALAAAHPGQFKVWYTLTDPGEGWEYSTGYVDEQMLRDHLGGPEQDGAGAGGAGEESPAIRKIGGGNGEGDTAITSIVMMCGPPPMLKFACVPNLKKIGYHKSQMFFF